MPLLARSRNSDNLCWIVGRKEKSELEQTGTDANLTRAILWCSYEKRGTEGFSKTNKRARLHLLIRTVKRNEIEVSDKISKVLYSCGHLPGCPGRARLTLTTVLCCRSRSVAVQSTVHVHSHSAPLFLSSA